MWISDMSANMILGFMDKNVLGWYAASVSGQGKETIN